EPVQDVVTTQLMHDTKDEISPAYGKVTDWKYDKDIEPVPGVNFPRVQVVERDYTKIYEKFITLGENIRDQIGAKGIGEQWKAEHDKLKKSLDKNKHLKYENNVERLETDREAAEGSLALSSTTKENVAMKAWKAQGENTRQELAEIAIGRTEEQITL